MSHAAAGGRTLRVLHFGSRLVRYSEGLALQERLAEQRKLDQIPDTLLVLQVGTSAPYTVHTLEYASVWLAAGMVLDMESHYEL
jgi:hypothetical protein